MPNKHIEPLWCNPQRKAKLVELFYRSGGFCVFGHQNCQIPEHHYSVFIEGLIADWKAEDREQRAIEYRLEGIRLHQLNEPKTPLRGRFSAISKEIYRSNQPLYSIEGLGFSGLTLEPFVKVKMSSSFMRLYVNLGTTLRGISKSQRRKAIRYGKPVPTSVEQAISHLVNQSVKDYLSH